MYTSVTGNTEEAMNIIYKYMSRYTSRCNVYQHEHFPLYELDSYDAIIIGTYTWGNGDIPNEMISLYRAFENTSNKDIVTAVFGTGDQCYPHYCGAVDEFRDMLFVHSNLAATLKIELMPQFLDEHRFERFVEVIMERVKNEKGITI